MTLEHDNKILFQSAGNLLRLAVPHAVVVEQRHVDKGQNTIPHHRLYAVTAPARGGGSVCNPHDGTLLELVGGGLYFMPAHMPLEYAFSPGLRMTAFHFTLSISEGFDLFHGQQQLARRGGQMAIAKEMMAVMQTLETPGALVCGRALLMQMASGFMERSMADIHALVTMRERYRPIFDSLDRSCTARLRVASLARLMSITPAALARNFRRDLGTTLKAFISQHLTQRASEALLLSDKSIKEIAYDLEFANEFYFSRFFKKHTTTTPSAFRRAHEKRNPSEGRA